MDNGSEFGIKSVVRAKQEGRKEEEETGVNIEKGY